MSLALRALGATLAWTLFVASGWLILGAVLGDGISLTSDLWELVGYATAFCSFAGGVVVADRTRGRPRELWLTATMFGAMAGVAYVVFAYTVPLYDFRVLSQGPGDPQFPFGPETPEGLRALLDSVSSNPPGDLSALGAFRESPAWVRYQLAKAQLIAVFLPVSVLLGAVVAGATSHLRPGSRRRLRWAVGLMSAAAFIAADVVASGHIRANPTGGGLFRAWASLYPSLVCVALAGVVRVVRRD